MIAPIYLFLERLIRFTHNAAAALIQGVALGLLSNPQLERLTEHRYAKHFASYASELHVKAGLFIWEREAVRRYFPRSGRVLVAAAGAGREMIALAGCGFRVDGFDCCAPLVEAGRNFFRQLDIEAKLVFAPPSTMPACEGRYDAVLVGFSGYMYIPGRDRRIRFLRELSRLAIPGAPVMVSFTEGEIGRRRVWSARIGTFLRKLRAAEPVEEGDCLKAGFQHHFVREQIVSEMTDAGLELVRYSGGTSYGHAVGVVR
jgi:hypothetical protein